MIFHCLQVEMQRNANGCFVRSTSKLFEINFFQMSFHKPLNFLDYSQEKTLIIDDDNNETENLH